MSFKAEESNIYELFNRKIYSIPRNQRRYVWTKRNWEELYDDIAFLINKDNSHFIGSFVLTDKGRENGVPMFMIVDGQQRIITITILLASILFWLRKKKLSEYYEGIKNYIFAKDDKAKNTIMLKSDYHLAIENIINGICYTSDDEFDKISFNTLIEKHCINKNKDSNIAKAFKFFMQKIKEQEELSQDEEYIVKLKNQILNTSYISIITNDELDSYTIFEILNARGIELEDYELLKNYIMRYISPECQRDKAKIIWNEMENDLGTNFNKFVKHYTIHITKYNKAIKTTSYKILHDFYQHKDKYDFLNDLKRKSLYYKKIISPQTECDNDSVEYFVLNFFKKQKQEQFRPVLISLMNQFEMKKISKQNYEEILESIYRFYVCFHIIGKENSNKITDLIYKYAPILEIDFSKENLKLFIDDLKKKLPNKENFENAFRNLGYSKYPGFYEGDKNKKTVFIVLELLERYKNNGYCKDDYTIEHVLDDYENSENGQIGNLILLEANLNSNLNRKEYNYKIEVYKKSNYLTTRSFAERYAKIESFSPSERTKYLSRIFYKDILKITDD